MSNDLSSSIQSAMTAMSEGKNPMDAAFGDLPTSGSEETSPNEVSKFFDDEENGTSGEGDSQPAADDTQSTDAATTEGTLEPKPSGNKEKITITGPNGKEEIEIDYSDRDAIKKAFSMSHGARKWQSERDSFAKRIKEIEPDYKDAVEVRDSIVGSFKQKGIKGLVNFLQQDELAYDKMLDLEMEKRAIYQKAEPSLKAKMDAEERYESLLNEMKYKEEQNKAAEAKNIAKQKEIEQSELTVASESFNTMSSTAMQQHSFRGKLGDNELEARIDESVWTNVRKALMKLPDETDISQQMLNDLVAKEAALFSKGLGRKVDSEVKQKVEQKKVASATKLASDAQQGMGKGGAAEKFSDALSKGDTASAVKAFFGLRK
jgi:hypothetical protein